jgi:peptidoglycan/xylan/chitin deacetylase (PgdA/CDA1 family)
LRKGQFYCKDTCDPKSKRSNEKSTAAHRKTVKSGESGKSNANGKRRTFFTHFLPLSPSMLLAIITLFLCFVALTLWTIKKIYDIEDENAALSRTITKLHVQLDQNTEILDSILVQLHTDTVVKSTGKQEGKKTKRRRASIDNLPDLTQPRSLPYTFDNGTNRKKLVALTFDGGSHYSAAKEILDTLHSRHIRATMFVTGWFIRKNPGVIKRIVHDGHEVGNHTYSHPHLTSWAQDRTHTTLPSVSQSGLCEELSKTNTIFRSLIGKDMAPLWRAPYGERNRQICRWAHTCGYLHVGWRQGRSWRQTLDTNDWVPDEETPGYHSPDEVLEKILNLARQSPYGINGGIVLMHLGTVRKNPDQQVHRVLGRLIDSLRELGYHFVTVSELAHVSGITLDTLSKTGLHAQNE